MSERIKPIATAIVVALFLGIEMEALFYEVISFLPAEPVVSGAMQTLALAATIIFVVRFGKHAISVEMEMASCGAPYPHDPRVGAKEAAD
ncbi:hypothetical protein GCM10007972_13050 [Iodidimonas muriae]|uniref:Uncharacterized protein n=1 Tax=Iodidimonas muriae TaxID=261467 RepID=A0ABQ2LCE2_9PROT|nr:hypothetical protein JCM17843_09980 [Kordiimonadales bacterium JCM 17843]GGO10361.1 hypothetical protein GCM10007972_13050 [Iodidimonas muriae]